MSQMPPTPGQVAHETYWRTFAGRPPTLPWAQLIPENRAAWDAAAQAVLAQKDKEGDAMTPREGLEHLETILSRLARLRDAFHDRLNRADLSEAQTCLEDVAMRLREDTQPRDVGLEDAP